MAKKLNAWNNKLFSDGGREVLIKSVIQAIPTYAMSCFRVPTTIIKEIESMTAKFWWGGSDNIRKLHWKSWKYLTLPKDRGGMGFRDLTLFNKALLAKHVWRMISNPDTPVARVFKTRYFKHMDIMEASLGSNPSFVWRSLLWGREALRDKLYWKIGKGDKINITRDKWIPDLNSGKVNSNRQNCYNLTIQSLMNDQGSWDMRSLIAVFYHMKSRQLRLSISRALIRRIEDFGSKRLG